MIKLILMAALLFVSGVSIAQKVVNVGGAAIIDNRGLPAGAITRAKKPLTTNATSSAMGTNDLNNLSSNVTNETVSHYFEVAKTDSNNGVGLAWLEAVNSCGSYTSGDGNDTWRATTQREWQLIWILHESLIQKKIPGFVALSNNRYWTASESDISNGPWHAISNPDDRGQGGYLFNNAGKTSASYAMRCVRDLTPPAK